MNDCPGCNGKGTRPPRQPSDATLVLCADCLGSGFDLSAYSSPGAVK